MFLTHITQKTCLNKLPDANIMIRSTMRFSGIRYTKASSCEQTDMDSSVLQVQLMNLYYIIRYSPRPIFFGVTFDL